MAVSKSNQKFSALHQSIADDHLAFAKCFAKSASDLDEGHECFAGLQAASDLHAKMAAKHSADAEECLKAEQSESTYTAGDDMNKVRVPAPEVDIKDLPVEFEKFLIVE